MKILKIYQNFFLRNLILNAIVFGVIFVCVFDEMKFEEHSWVYVFSKICLGYFPCIVWITCFNLFIIKPFLFKKKYELFFVLLLVYWAGFYFFMRWYFPIADLGKFRTLSILSLVVNGIAFFFIHIIIYLLSPFIYYIKSIKSYETFKFHNFFSITIIYLYLIFHNLNLLSYN